MVKLKEITEKTIRELQALKDLAINGTINPNAHLKLDQCNGF